MAIFRKKKHEKDPTVNPSETRQNPPRDNPVDNDMPLNNENKHENTTDGVFKRLRHGLTKTRSSFTGRIDNLFAGKKEITEALMDELEEILFTSDIGVATTQSLLDAVREKVTRKELKDPAKLKEMLKNHILSLLDQKPIENTPSKPEDPFVIMVAGVNGVGKTTSMTVFPSRL